MLGSQARAKSAGQHLLALLAAGLAHGNKWLSHIDLGKRAEFTAKSRARKPKWCVHESEQPAGAGVTYCER
jgi:hypothetical protein